jgi:hypothetical protein
LASYLTGIESADPMGLFVKKQFAAPFTNSQPSVSAFVGLAAFFTGSSFQTAAIKIGCVRFLTAIPAAAAFKQ